MKSSSLWQQIVEPRDAVFARFQPIFQRSYIPKLSADEFRPFLYFEENHHWTGLHRQVNRVCADMDALRQALLTLTDEEQALAQRLNKVGDAIHGAGKAIITAVLTVAFPAKYGVWNSVSEDALARLELWPEFRRGASFGERYTIINDILVRLANAVSIDLWTLDAVFWQLSRPGEIPGTIVTEAAPLAVALSASTTRFGLERHLHDFLFDNWNETTLGKEWALFTEPGDPEAGYEYRCPIGRIDLLARHKTEKKWLVVELKRDDATDAVVGQVLRYVGWVRRHLAEPQDDVLGLIIARTVDPQLQYAIEPVPKLRAMTYEVEFRLIDSPQLPGRPDNLTSS
jgi:hypothetical protein